MTHEQSERSVVNGFTVTIKFMIFALLGDTFEIKTNLH